MNQNIAERTFEFAVHISKYQLSLKEKKYYEVASQLFRSGTSVGANVAKAQSGSSKNYFINKMNIALKESKETIFWLRLLEKGFNEDTSILQKECEEITKILVTIIKNTKTNMQK